VIDSSFLIRLSNLTLSLNCNNFDEYLNNPKYNFYKTNPTVSVLYDNTNNIIDY